MTKRYIILVDKEKLLNPISNYVVQVYDDRFWTTVNGKLVFFYMYPKKPDLTKRYLGMVPQCNRHRQITDSLASRNYKSIPGIGVELITDILYLPWDEDKGIFYHPYMTGEILEYETDN